MKTNIITITFLFLMIATIGKAQETEEMSMDSTKKEGFAVQSVNLTMGYYSPGMDYWNDTYLPAKGLSETFGGNPVFGVNITFSLPAALRARVGASIWSGKVNGKQGSTVDGLKIGFTRFNLGLFYAPEAISFADFQPYIGVEGFVNLISNEYDIDNTTVTQSGQDMSFAPVFGIDRAFGSLNLGIEAKYNMGNYIQEETFVETLEHEVSINGAEVSLTIGYKF